MPTTHTIRSFADNDPLTIIPVDFEVLRTGDVAIVVPLDSRVIVRIPDASGSHGPRRVYVIGAASEDAGCWARYHDAAERGCGSQSPEFDMRGKGERSITVQVVAVAIDMSGGGPEMVPRKSTLIIKPSRDVGDRV